MSVTDMFAVCSPAEHSKVNRDLGGYSILVNSCCMDIYGAAEIFPFKLSVAVLNKCAFILYSV